MRVAVFGPSGMLGRQVVACLREAGYEPQPIYRRMFDVANRDSIARVLEDSKSEAVINCAGMIPIRSSQVVDMILVNSVFPHILVSCGLPTILVSTDCVFSGRSSSKYTVRNLPDPTDYYGRSKALGEVVAPNSCVVRTSFIGCEHGFMNWVMQSGTIANAWGGRARINGYKNALWTGSTVSEVAKELAALLGSGGLEAGVVHLASDTVVNKYDLAVKIVDMKKLNVEVLPAYQPTINRALQPTHSLPGIDEALSKYVCSGAVG